MDVCAAVACREENTHIVFQKKSKNKKITTDYHHPAFNICCVWQVCAKASSGGRTQ